MANNTTIPLVDGNSKSQILFGSFVTLCIISTIALAEHIAVMFIVFSNKTLRTKPVTMSVLLLSCNDILLSLAYFVMSLNGLVPIQQTWICALTYYLIQVGFVTSLISTFTICIERYLCLRPTPFQPFSLQQRLKVTFISMGICTCIFGIPYIFTVKTPTIHVCGMRPLFQENLPYVRAPVRSIMFLLWISTVVVYVVTTKNFRNFMKMENNMRSRQLTTYNDIPKPTKTGHIDNTDLQAVSQSCSRTELLVVRETDIQSMTLKYAILIRGGNQNKTDTVINGDLPTETNQEITTLDRTVDGGFHTTIGDASGKQNVDRPMTNNKSSGRSGSTKLERHTQTKSHSQLKVVKAFRIVSVVFVVFLLSMTGQCFLGLVMVFSPMPVVVEAVCGLLATSTVLSSPIIYVFLLKDFRKGMGFTCR